MEEQKSRRLSRLAHKPASLPGDGPDTWTKIGHLFPKPRIRPSQPTRFTDTVANIDENSRNKAITRYSKPSNFDHLGGLEAVVRDTPERFDNAHRLNPLATCGRRISPQPFAVIIHPIWLRWPTFRRPLTGSARSSMAGGQLVSGKCMARESRYCSNHRTGPIAPQGRTNSR